MFTPKAGLAPAEASAACLVDNAGKPLDSGKQAECYANKYIALHLSEMNGGKTYAETSTVARAGAHRGRRRGGEGVPPTPPRSTPRRPPSTGKVQTLFRGETLRGLLLTSYGFSEFGRKADQAATVAFLAAFVLFLASIAGLVHALRTPKDKVVA